MGLLLLKTFKKRGLKTYLKRTKKITTSSKIGGFRIMAPAAGTVVSMFRVNIQI